jgi:hypothetical protein
MEQDFLGWLTRHFWIVSGAGGFLLAAITPWFGAWVRSYEAKKAKEAEQKKAANDLLHAADDFRRYWAKRHFDYVNQQVPPEEEPGWPMEVFDPLIKGPTLEAIYSRLSAELQARVFKLNQDIKNVGRGLSALIEWDTDRIEDEGPIRDAEIAIEAYEVFLMIAAEAGMKVEPDDEVDWIRSWLETAQDKLRKQIEVHRRSTKEFFATQQSNASDSGQPPKPV